MAVTARHCFSVAGSTPSSLEDSEKFLDELWSLTLQDRFVCDRIGVWATSSCCGATAAPCTAATRLTQRNLRADTILIPRKLSDPHLQKSDAKVHFLTDPTICSRRRRGQL
jgi:hypothetical protein